MHRSSCLAIGCTAALVLMSCNNQQTTSGGTNSSVSGVSTAAAPLPKAMLGVRMAHSGPALAAQLGIDADKTTLITLVAEDTPAQRAGFEQWDIIVAIEGAADASPASVRSVLRSSAPGDSISCTVLRADKRMTIDAILAEPDTERMVPLPPQPTSSS